MKQFIKVTLFAICGLLIFNVLHTRGQGTDTTKKTPSQSYFNSYAQTHNKSTENLQIPETGQNEASWIQDRLCIALLVFAFLLCAGEMVLFIKGKIDQQMIIKLIILTLVIFAILFLITAGYNDAQTQTSVSLLGTIAGYLLGRTIPDSAQPVLTPPASTMPATVADTNH